MNIKEIEAYLKNITSFNRLSGTEGERKAVEYIKGELEREGVKCSLYEYPALISNPLDCNLWYENDGKSFKLPSKTRSFSFSTDGNEIAGELKYIPGSELIQDLVMYELNKNNYSRDLEGLIVISETMNPAALLELQCRGASGYIQYWSSSEKLIHEGIYDPVWGMPLPDETEYYPKLPCAAVSGPYGTELLEKLKKGKVTVHLSTMLKTGIIKVPILEAEIMPEGSSHYLLIGNHLDSWHYGVTDNGTGNAIALYLAKRLKEMKSILKYGVRIVWWPGIQTDAMLVRPFMQERITGN